MGKWYPSKPLSLGHDSTAISIRVANVMIYFSISSKEEKNIRCDK